MCSMLCNSRLLVLFWFPTPASVWAAGGWTDIFSFVSRALYTLDVGLAFGFLGGSLFSGALYTSELCYAVSAILLSFAIWCSGCAVGTSFQPRDILDVGSTKAAQDVLPDMLLPVPPNPLIPLVTNVVVRVAVAPRPARLFIYPICTCTCVGWFCHFWIR